METIGDTLVIWISGESPYIFRNVCLKSISTNHNGNTNGYQDVDLKLFGKLESKNGTIKMNFKDGEHTINIDKFVSISKDYGNLEDMTFEQFKERLLVLEI